VAIDYALQWGIEPIWARIRSLADDLRGQLSAIPGVTVRDQGSERCGIVSFTVAGHGADEIQHGLTQRRMNVSVSRVASTRLDMEKRGLPDLVRASVHYYNTEEEISRFCAALASI
jgi:selenocysteine lyase/cysteine desulfurase